MFNSFSCYCYTTTDLRRTSKAATSTEYLPTVGGASRHTDGWLRLQGLAKVPEIWVVLKIMVPFWVPSIVRPQIFGVPKRDHNFDNHPYRIPKNHFAGQNNPGRGDVAYVKEYLHAFTLGSAQNNEMPA